MIVLDTHVLVWWLNGNKNISPKAKKLLGKYKNEENSILISVISAWELAMLVEKGRLILNMDIESWLMVAQAVPAIRFVPIDNEIAIKSTKLPGEFHKDPADRMIVALARKMAFPLITADEKILNYEHVKTIW